ncbi:hypothetical protein BKA93DRAFT_825669 [Sparassis latifolia]
MATSTLEGSTQDASSHFNIYLSVLFMADIPIDPILLQEEASANPPSVLDFITEIQANYSTVLATLCSHASSISRNEKDQAQERIPADQPHGTRQTRKEYEGEGTHYEAELARFSEAPHLIQHTISTYRLLLECHDHLQKLSRDSKYKIPDTLRATLTDYAHTYILSPTIESYRKATNPGNILAAMRHLNITQISSEQETGWCGVIRTVIIKDLTEWWNHVKTQIATSIDPKSNICNIAALAHACIKTCSARPTIATYIRLAYIRLIFVKFSGLKEDALLEQSRFIYDRDP